jgi:hypothetical protein
LNQRIAASVKHEKAAEKEEKIQVGYCLCYNN